MGNSTSTVSDTQLSTIPADILKELVQHTAQNELALLARTSKDISEFATGALYPLPLDKLHDAVRWACRNDKKEALRNLCRRNTRSFAKCPELGALPLHYACRTGDVEVARILLDAGNQSDIVELLVANGADLKALNFDDTYTILFRGRPGHFTTAEIMVRLGLNIYQVNENGNSLLHYICGRIPASWTTRNIQLLLDLGFDINRRNANGETALTAATRADSPEVVSLLVSRGADINAGISSGKSALWALLESHKEKFDTAKTLLRLGAIMDKDLGLRIFQHADTNDWRQSLPLFVEAWKSQFSVLDCSDPKFLFCAAAATGNLELLGDILRLRKTHPDYLPQHIFTLVPAARNGQDEALELLIPHVMGFEAGKMGGERPVAENSNRDNPGYKINACDEALRDAIREGTERSIRLLLPHTTFGGMTQVSRTMVCHAVEKKSAAIVALLMDHFTSQHKVNPLFMCHETARDLPRVHSPLSLVQFLLPILDCAVGQGKLETVRLLFNYDPSIKTECNTSHLLYGAIANRHTDTALEVINWGIAPNTKDDQGFTPLMRAAEAGLTDVVKALLKLNDIDVMTKYNSIPVGPFNTQRRQTRGQTALHLAAGKGYGEIIDLLLDDERVDVSCVDDGGSFAWELDADTRDQLRRKASRRLWKIERERNRRMGF